MTTDNTSASAPSASAAAPAAVATSGAAPIAAADTAAAPAERTPGSAAWRRVIGEERVKKGTNFAKSYGKAWVAMSPLYLMGEAISGKQPGSKFRNEFKGLTEAATELRDVLATSSKDILVVIDEQLSFAGQNLSVVNEQTKQKAQDTARLIQDAGQNALVVVSTNLEQSREQIKASSPKLKQSFTRHGKDCVVVVDKALKHPLVITGVSKLARTQGIPYAEAVLKVASLGLSKLVKVLPTDEEIANMVSEIDALQLERTSTQEAQDEALRIGKAVEQSPAAATDAKASTTKPAQKKDGSCLIC